MQPSCGRRGHRVKWGADFTAPIMDPGLLIDAFPGLFPAGGIGRYVRDLSHALRVMPGAPAARFAYPRNLRALAEERYLPYERLEIPRHWKFLALRLAAGTVMGERFDDLYGRPAVFHSTLGYGPRFARARLIDHVHDLTFLEHPEWHAPQTQVFLRLCVPPAARSADVVLTHSEFVRRRVVEVLGVAAERTITIPPPLGHGFRPVPPEVARERVLRRFGLEGPFVLHVGSIEPRKNHVTLVAAYERAVRGGFPGPLVLVGKDGWRMGPILARIESSPERRNIRRLVGLEDDDLVALYGACTACAFPSLEEGFGMPLLESMACGAVCITSDHPALTELGEGASLAVPATDADALAQALLRLWREPEERARIAAPGPARAEPYRFERWAERIFALYRRELEAAGRRMDGGDRDR